MFKQPMVAFGLAAIAFAVSAKAQGQDNIFGDSPEATKKEIAACKVKYEGFGQATLMLAATLEDLPRVAAAITEDYKTNEKNGDLEGMSRSLDRAYTLLTTIKKARDTAVDLDNSVPWNNCGEIEGMKMRPMWAVETGSEKVLRVVWGESPTAFDDERKACVNALTTMRQNNVLLLEFDDSKRTVTVHFPKECEPLAERTKKTREKAPETLEVK